MTDKRTRASVPRRQAWGWRRIGIAVGVATSLGLGVGAGGGCQNRAGMACQQQSDCSPGLLCNKPPTAGLKGYGICEPGLHGLGEICVGSADCTPGLVCSTELGQPSEDGWHGMCQVGSLPDGATSDLSAAPDLGTARDLGSADGSPDL